MIHSGSDLSPGDNEKYEEEYDDRDGGNDIPDTEFGGTEARKLLERKFIWKVDLRMSVLVVIYILNFIDRNNVGSARLRGFEKDLKLQGQFVAKCHDGLIQAPHKTGAEFATVMSILYVGYIIMQVPSNMFLNWTAKPSLYIPACMIVWGTISCLTVCDSFTGALLTRFFLGFVEAAFFPGALFLLTKWYKRNELSLRIAILCCGNIISNAFGALMASGILSGMEGKLGHAAWRWLFFIEGSLTIAIAILAIFILPDFPETTRWLTDDERALALRRLQEDMGSDEEMESGGLSGLWMAITDWKVWWMALLLTSWTVTLSFNTYFPTLSATMGFNRTVTLLMCAPPFLFTAIVAFILSRHSDMTNERCFHCIGPLAISILGFVIAISTMNTAARYLSLFLMAQSFAGFIIFYAWISQSFPQPVSKRAVALALTNGFSPLGNVAGAYVWPSAWGPTYRNSYGICVATSGVAIIMCLVLRWHMKRENFRMERDEVHKGVSKKGFRYIL
ncbi:hypothetical protein CVT25_001292 [Psilocybe cyanescens]|uniref:Major facilitator superfamily (MFS) profile domain-containing protein n=1 Tax=Psilocybe cyanescens TaxID=93625 RepID=A0A409W4I7_PSICY|nr:hypothetical protein CVT25_001292 [Psilocybe cyanescens]